MSEDATASDRNSKASNCIIPGDRGGSVVPAMQVMVEDTGVGVVSAVVGTRS
jgi:hypothetical protein